MRKVMVELQGMTMGIVGLGGTGRDVAKRARAFGMDCIAVDSEDVPPCDDVSELWGMRFRNFQTSCPGSFLSMFSRVRQSL
jgi:phosphoglycerate dehydrogenase-like enzyme